MMNMQGHKNFRKTVGDYSGLIDKKLERAKDQKKLIPLRVKEYVVTLNGRTSLISECPTCGKFVSDGIKQKYCYECGQALKWSDDE